MAPSDRRTGRYRLWRRVDDEVSITNRLMGDGELENTVEEKSAAARTAAVEPEHELVEVLPQMIGLDGSLVGPEQPSLRQRSHVVDAGHQLRRLVLRHDLALVV